MSWTTYAGNRQGIEDLYNGSTYLKERYAYSYDTSYEWASIFTSTLNTVRNNFRSLVAYGLMDNTVSDYIVPISTAVDFQELVAENDVEVYAFRDNTTPAHFLMNVFGENENGTLFCLHAGVSENGSSFCLMNSDNQTTAVDISSLITAYNTVNTSYGSKYVVQPLVVLDEKTPFYMLAGNTTVLEPFTEILVQTKKFMVVANGICVEVE